MKKITFFTILLLIICYGIFSNYKSKIDKSSSSFLSPQNNLESPSKTKEEFGCINEGGIIKSSYCRFSKTKCKEYFLSENFDFLTSEEVIHCTSYKVGVDGEGYDICDYVEETFPQLLLFLKQRQVVMPKWLQNSTEPDNPWPTRAAFNAAQHDEQMRELRTFLLATASLQAEFIISRFSRTEEKIVFSFPPADRSKARRILQGLAAEHPPLGQYALIDYLHFKGSGLNSAERYNDMGWGLKQVIAEMLGAEVSLQQFVQAGTAVLDRRISNSPVERKESRWRAGWRKRLQSYLPPVN